jgi:hypothetical protein
MFSDGDGEVATRIARAAVDGDVRPPPILPDPPEALRAPGGVFVTLNTYPTRDLRGCIGFPEARYPLHEALILAAKAACEDPRFPPLTPRELDGVTVEVSLLSPPEDITARNPRAYLGEVVVGRHGLMVSRGTLSGLLLPQVPLEFGWDVEEYLAHACMKAGLMPDAWFEDGIRVRRFTADVFGEESPRGRVVRRRLGEGDAGRRGQGL